MVRLRDRWRRGERLISRVPQGHWKPEAPSTISSANTQGWLIRHHRQPHGHGIAVQRAIKLPALIISCFTYRDIHRTLIRSSRLNELARKVAERTIPHLYHRIDKRIAALSAGECMHCFHPCRLCFYLIEGLSNAYGNRRIRCDATLGCQRRAGRRNERSEADRHQTAILYR